jgi:hypothetical protein
MFDRLRDFWVPRLLFFGTLCIAGVLALAVALAPWLLGLLSTPETGVRLFAEDATVRRTALASALGLTVTAFFFFRPPPAPRPVKKPSRNSPPGNIAGA